MKKLGMFALLSVALVGCAAETAPAPSNPPAAAEPAAPATPPADAATPPADPAAPPAAAPETK